MAVNGKYQNGTQTGATLNGRSDSGNGAQNAPLVSPGLINVGQTERYVSLAAGGLLAYVLMKRGLISTAVLAGTAAMLVYRGLTGNCPIYKTLDVNTAVRTNPDAVSVPHQQGIHVEETVTIRRPAAQVYNFWRNLEQLPQFMDHLESVEVLDDKRSHWVAKAPAGLSVSWDAEIITDTPNEVIGWRSLPGAQIANAGSVRFSESGSGKSTKLTVTLEYMPPGGAIGAAVARLLGEEPQVQLQDDLRRLKKILEGDAREEAAEAGAGTNVPDGTDSAE